MLEGGSQLYCRGPGDNGEHQYGEADNIQDSTKTLPVLRDWLELLGVDGPDAVI